MSEKFNGFSQEEINQVSTKKRVAPHPEDTAAMKQAFRGQHNGIRRMPEKWSGKPATLTTATTTTATTTKTSNSETVKKQAKHNDVDTKRTIVSSASSTATTTTATASTTATQGNNKTPSVAMPDDSMNVNESLSKSLEEALFYQPLKATQPKATGNNAPPPPPTVMANADDSSILKMDSDVSSTSVASSTNTMDDSTLLPIATAQRNSVTSSTETAAGLPNTDSPFKGISLKDFESHRKIIEEQNKQKKELLYKAIEHHSRKTAAEARKIEDIKVELAKLDSDLAVDVAMLRKQIDFACINFANIEKQYVKIEAQFLKAKMDLHNAAEKKELLTEHLCTVIAHNEDRKAQQLSELMQKVGLTPSGEYEEPTSSITVSNN